MKSFRYAFKGIQVLLKSQHNAWIHAAATMLVISASCFYKLSRIEWCWIVLAILIVWIAEAFNTALEFLADAVTQNSHPLIGKAKDVAAGAVLIAAFGAVSIGLLIFGPYLFY